MVREQVTLQKTIYGNLEATGGVSLFEKKRSECTTYTMDEVHAWNEPHLCNYFFICFGYYFYKIGYRSPNEMMLSLDCCCDGAKIRA